MIDDRTPGLDLPLPNVNNYQDEDVTRLRAALTALDTAVVAKADLVGGKVPAAQLPAYVDDVVEYANVAALPGTGVSDVIYVTTDTDPVRQWRWSGSAYAEIAPAYVLPSATPSTLGGIKVGSGLNVAPDGTLSTVGGGAGSGLPVFGELTMTPASNGQTVFTPAGGYSAGQIELFLNGVLLLGNGDDYTATDGTTITLTTGVNTTDTLFLRRWIYLPEAQAVNKTGDTLTGALNDAPQVDVTSAATCNIGLAASNRVRITGNADILSFGTVAAGVARTVTFAGALALTHNTTSLILPGAANITTAAGDTAEFESLGAGNWRCTWYQRAGDVPMARFKVSGTTQTAVSGFDYLLENASATAVTAPAAVDGAEFAVTPANGLLTNAVDFGASSVIGPGASMSGVVTLDRGSRLRVKYSSTISKWVVMQ